MSYEASTKDYPYEGRIAYNKYQRLRKADPTRGLFTPWIVETYLDTLDKSDEDMEYGDNLFKHIVDIKRKIKNIKGSGGDTSKLETELDNVTQERNRIIGPNKEFWNVTLNELPNILTAFMRKVGVNNSPAQVLSIFKSFDEVKKYVNM